MEAPSLIGITCVTLSEQYVPYSHGILILHKVDIRNNNSNNNNTSAFYANMFFYLKESYFSDSKRRSDFSNSWGISVKYDNIRAKLKNNLKSTFLIITPSDCVQCYIVKTRPFKHVNIP